MENSVYKNINDSLFKKLDIVPKIVSDMIVFIDVHDELAYLDSKMVKTLCDNTSMTSLQLDGLFTICCCIRNNYDKLKKFAYESCCKNLKFFENAPREILKLSSDQQFLSDLTNEILQNFRNIPMEDEFNRRVLESLDTIARYSKLFNSENSDDGNLRLIFVAYITSNAPSIKNFLKNIYKDIMSEVNESYKKYKLNFPLCGITNPTEKELNVISYFIKTNPISLDFTNNFTLEIYYDIVSEHKYDSFDSDNIYSDNIFYTSRFDSIKDSVNSKLYKIGMELLETPSSKNFIHDVIDCFIDYGIVITQQEVIEQILDVLTTEYNTPGFTNKYDNITPYDHYVLITVANDIKTTYSNFIGSLINNKKLPLDYPIEFILRILSRLFNLIVNLYVDETKYISYFVKDSTGNFVPQTNTTTINKIEIDNTVDDQTVQYINIYQYAFDSFYVIIPIGQKNKFPSNDKPIVMNDIVNDLADIVSI